MSLFGTMLNQMLIMVTFIVIGFILERLNIFPANSDTVLSRLENYVLVPCLIINTFGTYCTVDNIADKTNLFVYGFVLLAVCMVIAVILAPRFTKKKEEVGIYRYSITVANFGFMGNAVVLNVFGQSMLFDYMIYTLPTNIFLYTLGVIWLTAGKQKFSLRMFVNPMFISMVAGIAVGLSGLKLPDFISQVVSTGSACYSPVAMILTGFVIGGFVIKKLLAMKKIYVLCLLRMIALPVLVYAILVVTDAPSGVMIAALCANAMPLGLNTIVFPAMYDLDKTPGASMAIISNVIGIITVPVMLSLMLPV